MDHPDDKKTTSFERRTSRRMSRHASIHAGIDFNDPADNDAYLAAMAMTVSDGFRPPQDMITHTTAPDAHHTISFSTPKDADNARRPSTSSRSHDDGDHMSTTTGTVSEIYSVGVDTPSFPASSPSSSTSSPSQSSSVPISVPAIQDPGTSFASVQPREIATARPSSIAKPLMDSLLHDGVASSHGAIVDSSSSNGGSNSRRAVDVRASSTSSLAPAQEEEPYQGPSGPSFPYQMYPQNVRVTRSLSSRTTATNADSVSSYTGPRGPTFPYGMYHQNAMAGPSTVPTSAIPIGFPGMTDNYQRRIGPEGEDIADIIGPDGHTEQLPPYTRYPDEAYARKIAAANGPGDRDPLTSSTVAQNSVPVAGLSLDTIPVAIEETPGEALALPAPAAPAAPAASVSPAAPAAPADLSTTSAPAALAPVVLAASAVPSAIHPIAGAGGIGLAPRNPEFDGTEDIESPHSRYSLRSFNSDGTSHEINTAARGMNEKRKPPNFIQRYGGRRILGIIPYWAICLVLTALLLMGIILGSVVGSFVARHKRAQEAHHDTGSPLSITVTVDATPIPTPANLASLPTGTFNLPLQKDEGPSACFNDTTQAQAWSCNIPFQYGMSVTIDSLVPTPGGPMYNISINCNESATVENNVYFYGEQAPVIKTPLPMQLVNDTLDPNRGPAWFKMLPYNKTVIVHETYLSVPTPTPTSGPSNNKRDFQDAAAALSFSVAGGFHRKGIAPAQVGEKPWICTWPDTIMEVFIYPNQNSSMYKISLSSTYTPSTLAPTPSISTASGVSLNSAVATSTGAMSSTETSPATPTQFSDMPPPYPRVVKVEERRMANSPEATCIQYVLKQDGLGLKAEPNLDSNGKIIEITIAEVESGPSLFAQSKREISGNDKVFEESIEKRDVSGLSKCGCLWMAY